MSNRFVWPEMARLSEFQSAVTRILGLIVVVTTLAMARLNDVYAFEWQAFEWLVGIHLFWFLLILLHVIRWPEFKQARTYVGLLADASGITAAIYLSGDPTSPFCLVYVLSILSQGTRYGVPNLTVASLVGMLFYIGVSWLLDGWQNNPFEVGFCLLLLVVLPIYQYFLINQLHRAKQAAEEANRARGNFLATMTHELRTPLSGVIGMTGLLRDTSLDQEQRTYVDSITASATTLQSLIGDILDLSKIDAGKLELRWEWFDLRAALLEVCRIFEPQALERRVDLVCRIRPDVPTYALGDDLRFRQVLFNLVGNAVKFTERGEVVVEVQVEQGRVAQGGPSLGVSVRDTGIGIPEEKVTRIFDSFWQADNSTTRKRGGTGLGTTIARDLVALMGGTIGVNSELGRGSRFWVSLPILEPTRLDAPVPPRDLEGRRVLCLVANRSLQKTLRETLKAAGMVVEMIENSDALGALEGKTGFDLLVICDAPQGLALGNEAERLRRGLGRELPIVFLLYPNRGLQVIEGRNLVLDRPCDPRELWKACRDALDPSRAVEQGQDERRAVTPKRARDSGIEVLVAEDDRINARLIHALLRKAGHRVTLTGDGRSALHAARAGSFDLALVDLRMPVMDGLDFTRAWREHEAAQGGERRMPIIALTANMAEEAREQCLAAGMDDFITKPIDPETLDGLIRRFVRRTAELRSDQV